MRHNWSKWLQTTLECQSNIYGTISAIGSSRVPSFPRKRPKQFSRIWAAEITQLCIQRENPTNSIYSWMIVANADEGKQERDPHIQWLFSLEFSRSKTALRHLTLLWLTLKAQRCTNKLHNSPTPIWKASLVTTGNRETMVRLLGSAVLVDLMK